MKKRMFTIIAGLIAIHLMGLCGALAQDTLDVPFDAATLSSMALKETIDNDVDRPEGRVYRLERGIWYFVTGVIESDFPLRIVGKTEPADVEPATLLYKTDAQGTSAEFMFHAADDAEFKNLYVACIDELENHHRFYQAMADSIDVWADNCYFIYANSWNGLFICRRMVNAKFTNNVILNNIGPQGNMWGRFVSCPSGGGENSLGDFIFENNTVIGSSGNILAIWLDMYGEQVVNHNTFLNIPKQAFQASEWINVTFTNNLFYNCTAAGDVIVGTHQHSNRNQVNDQQPYAMFDIDTLVVDELENAQEIWDNAGVDYQTAKVSNNNYFHQQKFHDLWASVGPDSVIAPLFINARTRAMMEDDANWPGLEFDDDTHWAVDPGFTNNPLEDDDAMLDYCTWILRGGDQPDFTWIPGSSKLEFPWPIEDYFDLTYSNAALVSSSGGHIGDLRWYPDEKATSVKESASRVTDFSLDQNYPNPFNPTTAIAYTLKKAGDVELAVYNLLGEKVTALVSEMQTAGAYTVKWDATNAAGHPVSAGVYFYKLSVGNQSRVHKMMLMK